jgi:DNA-binding NarL/FixJ family response regulator
MAVLIVSGHDESLYAERALTAGARGYLMKDQAKQHFIDAIRHVLAGGLYLSSQVKDRLAELQTEAGGLGWSPRSILTDREVEVFEAVGRAQTTPQIAARLGVSHKTVESHRASIMKKMKLKDAPDFMRRAALWVEQAGGYTSSATRESSPAETPVT